MTITHRFKASNEPLTPLAMALAVYLARTGYSQKDCADDLGVSASALSRLLKHHTHSTPDVRAKLLAALHTHGWQSLLVTEPWEKFTRRQVKADTPTQLRDQLLTLRVNNELNVPLPTGMAWMAKKDPNDQEAITYYFTRLQEAHKQVYEVAERRDSITDMQLQQISRAYVLLMEYSRIGFEQWLAKDGLSKTAIHLIRESSWVWDVLPSTPSHEGGGAQRENSAGERAKRAYMKRDI